MVQRPSLFLAALAALLLCDLALPESADARSRQRRNYAEEMRRDDLRKERDRERQRLIQQQQEYEEERRESWQEHSAQQQDRYLNHRERQLDKWLDHKEGVERQRAPAPAPAPAATGSCIYGAGDKVLYQPKGVVCSK